MFERRTNILTVVFLAAGCVLLVRLAQVQLVLHDQLATEDYSVLGGDHVTDTVRGGIYTRWGTPLAVQAPSFDLGVHYSRLLAVSSEAPGHALVRRYIDEFLSRSGPAGYGDDYRWDDYGRPQRGDAASPPPPDAVGQGRYEYIWSAARSTESRLLGALEAYVTRRLQGESLRWIARAPTRVAELRDWRQAVSELTGTPREELTEKAEGIVQQVERIQRRVQRSVEERSETQNGANYVRIV